MREIVQRIGIVVRAHLYQVDAAIAFQFIQAGNRPGVMAQ